MADMNGAGGASLLHAEFIEKEGRIGREGAAGRDRSGRLALREERVRRLVLQQGNLTREGGLKLMSQGEPLLGRTGKQGAERADDALTGTVGSVAGFDEEVIDVGLPRTVFEVRRMYIRHYI